jgi:DNA-binding CsgD family transcriptional regulator
MRDVRVSGSRKGKFRGEKSPRAILTEKSVIEMRLLRKAGMSLKKISDLFSISVNGADAAIRRRSWSHVL